MRPDTTRSFVAGAFVAPMGSDGGVLSGGRNVQNPQLGVQASKPPGNAMWRGYSGRLYRAAVERFAQCRAPARAAYILIRRDMYGRAIPVFAGLALSRAPTLNLARIRHRAAVLGASEVHVIDLTHSAGTYIGRRLVRDIKAGIALMR